MIMRKSSGPKSPTRGVGLAPVLRFRFKLPLRDGGEDGVIDYSGVFVGFGDDGFAVPDGKDLFGQLKKKAKTSSSASIPRSDRKATEMSISHISEQSDSGQSQSKGLCQSFDNVEHFEHKNNGITGNGATSASQVHDIPGSACQLNEGVPFQRSQSGRLPIIKDDTELGMDVNLAKQQRKHSMNATIDLGADEQNIMHDACYQKLSCFNVSKSVAASHDTCQDTIVDRPPEIIINGAKVESDVKGVGSMEVLSDLDANKKKIENDAGFHKASGLVGSSSIATSYDTSQVFGPSRMVTDEDKIATGLDVGKKQLKHSRMTSLDLRDYKRAHERDARFHQNSRLGTSYSFYASHDPFPAPIKMQSAQAVPSSSVPEFFPFESHCKMSENSRCESSANDLHSGVGGSSPPSSDEQLDVNSSAAVSVAALRRALQEAA